MDLGIEGRVALITGGAGGIGTATARLLLDEGCAVVLTDIDQGKLDAATNELGDGAVGVAADLTDAADVRKVASFVGHRGGAGILVSAAGVTGAKGHPLTEMTDEDYEDAWQIDFMSAVRVMREVVPPMAEKGWGRVVVVTSENAVQPYWEEAVYNVAKAALLNLTKGLSRRYAHEGVLVNSVAPAFIETPMTDGMMKKKADQEGVTKDEAIQEFLKEDRPYLEFDRRGKPEEVAAAIAFLCSERASFVNGSNYRVDGGSVGAIET
ncbi:NAD(P)-dependent dehydrogenase (short-subunit alcohol dehydrogenase family) [Hasllibacter halocynthiae]|uniref:NAD(P)-dependent dehydrogenase (Short-subunit alcohol dehydrogenase family) n=1 Tax=Hasllibacter halocynthiae TaxID=595589 RepID=A0A2T0X478_9RHOB|nr:SDR family oxidoreductase [Hasllibacter halocynthiae]PRY93746.1 NAD(P)-dependent dehydrogenase (short-subunit alcohol dehydrogenase family) [Hasllibacter halocynthiae]